MQGIKDKVVVITGASSELRKFSRAGSIRERGSGIGEAFKCGLWNSEFGIRWRGRRNAEFGIRNAGAN